MLSLWTFVKWIHVIGAVVWLGGLSFVVIVLRPALSRLPDMHLRRQILGQVVERMRRVVNVVATLQVLTGAYMTWTRIGGSPGRLTDSAWGLVLLAKITLAGLMLALYVVVPRLLLSGPQGNCDEISGPPLKQKLGNMLHMVLLGLGLTVIFLAKILTA